MDAHSTRIAMFYKYRGSFLQTSGDFAFDEISDNQWENIRRCIAPSAKKETIVGFLDTSLTNSGKSGCLFTDEKVYFLETMEKPQKIWYDEIDHIKLAGDADEPDNERFLRIYMDDGKMFEWQNPALNKTAVGQFILLNRKLEQTESENATRVFYDTVNDIGATIGGLAAGTKGMVNKSYDEERFHGRQGHGFAAERANDLYDRVTGHDAQIVGDNNAKNGPDRVVDGIFVQSKYCKTGARCVSECFEQNGKGAFRYMTDNGPMQIEVPSDKYQDAIQAMEAKIRNGQVPGVTDPKEAENIIRKGHFTYQQAVNISKFGTVESLVYDAANGIVIGSTAFGVSSVITFATSFWNGEAPEVCLQRAAYTGLKVGGVTFLATLIGGQLSKAGLNSLLVGGTEKIVGVLGPKASAILINAFRNSSQASLAGAAAMKSASKLLRGNIISGTITFVLLSSADVVRIFRGRISGPQLFKNLLCTAASVGGGSAGMLAGAAAGSVVIPVIGSAIGAIGGAVLGGAATEKVVHSASDQFIEDDADKMADILQDAFTELCDEYLLTAKEAEKSVDRLSEKLDGHTLRDMFASDDQKAFARDLITPILENQIKKRKHVYLPSRYALTSALKTALESIEDEASA